MSNNHLRTQHNRDLWSAHNEQHRNQIERADASPLDPRFNLSVSVKDRQVVLHGGPQGIGSAFAPDVAEKYANEILRAVAHIASLCLCLWLSSCVGSVGGPTSAEAADGSDAAQSDSLLALGNDSRVNPALPTPCEMPPGCDPYDHYCVTPENGGYPPGVGLTGLCLLVCSPSTVADCTEVGGSCQTLAFGATACIP